MKKLVLALVACLSLAGCYTDYSVPSTSPYALSPSATQYGCVVVSDEYGEREVCDTHYYYTDGGVVYYDAHFGIWVGPNGYWAGRGFYPGVYPGFHAYYGRGFYHARGFYRVRGGFHGGFHGGGFHGGHGGHR